MSDPAFQVRIRADKTGPQPAEGQPWPAIGLEIIGDPPEHVSLPVSFVRRNTTATWVRTEGSKVVERPSRAEPGMEKGTLMVIGEHRLYVSSEQPMPHVFEHVDRIILDTLNYGEVVYKVDRQPDKYATDENGDVLDDEAKVTPELYAEGRTRVDNFYACTLVATGKES